MFGWLSAEADFGFLDEATPAIAGFVADVRREDFQCDFAVEFGVVGEVDLTHSTRAELGADFVATNSFARGERQCSIRGKFLLGSQEVTRIVAHEWSRRKRATKRHKRHKIESAPLERGALVFETKRGRF